MKTMLITTVALFILSGCASKAMTQAQIDAYWVGLENRCESLGLKKTGNGDDLAFYQCVISMDNQNKERPAAIAAAMINNPIRIAPATFTPMTIPQAPASRSTNCTSNMIGGTVFTNCN